MGDGHGFLSVSPDRYIKEAHRAGFQSMVTNFTNGEVSGAINAKGEPPDRKVTGGKKLNTRQ